MHVKFYFFLTILFFLRTGTFAQSNQYQFSQLDINNGLSHNQVNCIYKDSEGFMWFGTASGLNRYDGYTFKVFKHDADKKNSLRDDFIVNIFESPDRKLIVSTRTGYCFYDPETEQFNSDMSVLLGPLKIPVYPEPSKIIRNDNGDFWILCPDSGLFKYNIFNRKTTRYYHHNNSEPSLYSNFVADIAEDTKGNIWLVYQGGMVEMLDIKRNKISYSTNIFSKAINNKTGNYAITVDIDNDLWVYIPNVNTGVYYYSPSTGIFRHLDKESKTIRLKSSIISNIIQADNGLIWIATDQGGINVLNKKNFQVTYLLNREDDAKSLRQNTVILYKDNTGIMWAGTFKDGISYYHKNIIRFALYRHFASDPSSLSFDDVNKFVEDKEGNLWIGTNGGGLIYFNRKTNKFRQYRYDPGNSNSLSNDIIVSLCIDHDQKLWIGTYFGGLDCFDGKTFTHYKHDDKIATSIADDRIWSIFEDSSQRLWIGTFAGGLEIFDRSKKAFYHPFKQTDIRCPFISSIIEDKSGNIWIGGYMGIDVIIKKSNRVIHYTRKANGLIDDNINSIKQDSRGLFWIATRDGLSILNPATKSFTSLTKKNGLPDNSILDVLEDNKGTMWLSTSNGLSRITLTPRKGAYTFQFENFDETDGLQGREFNLYASLKTSKGEMIFGGGHGFSIFNPISIHSNINKPKLMFTDFQLFNKSIAANESFDGDTVLTKAIWATHEITLEHSENVFTIEFAAINFLNPNKVKYQYMMEGFDKGWLNADNAFRKATYTNLDAGNYVFKVRAYNSEGLWNPDYVTLKVKVLPPFWKSTPAYIIYLSLIVGVLFVIRRRGIQKIKKGICSRKGKGGSKVID